MGKLEGVGGAVGYNQILQALAKAGASGGSTPEGRGYYAVATNHGGRCRGAATWLILVRPDGGAESLGAFCAKCGVVFQLSLDHLDKLQSERPAVIYAEMKEMARRLKEEEEQTHRLFGRLLLDSSGM